MILSPKVFSVDGWIGRFPVRICSELRHVADDFAAFYSKRSPDVETAETATPMEIAVRRSGRTHWGKPLYQVTADGYEVGGRNSGSAVFPFVEWGINLRIMATRNEFLQLHAATLAYQGCGFVFAGDSGCGKSTLAATLLSRDWSYLCDEFALVDPSSLDLEPFPKALCIKAGSYDIVRKLGLSFERRRDYVKAFKGRVGYIHPRYGGREPGRRVKAQFVILPKYEKGSPPALLEISRAEAAAELYRCCFNKAALPEFGLLAIKALVEASRCFRLTTGAPNATGELIEGLVERPAKIAPRATTSPWPGMQARNRQTSRREMLKIGAKLAYVAPCVLTLTSRQAFAAPSNPSGFCSTANHTGQLCETDMDCCTKECNLGVCR